ncbi:MAG: recombinase family protein [Planctomycetaceae bacterium]|nr:recombinase family protein [Planctomycetaceae bacterium]
MTWWKKNDVALIDCRCAAIYCRNSADIGQENSCEIQEEKCRDFAGKNGFEIIAVYADRGKSGLNAEGRPEFQALLERVKTDNSFQSIIVLDVSRWGRFQDIDLSGHYETVCRQYGKEVIYVSHGIIEKDPKRKLLHQLHKDIDRFQAAEYSETLSEKTKAGAVKVAQQGYRPGGSPPYGMRRVMLDEQKNRDRVLDPGQRKGLQNGRTILEPGDQVMQAVIHEIFELFVEKDYAERQIAGHLNSKGIPSPGGVSWSPGTIRKILGDEQYAGSVVYNKTSGPLKSKTKPNPPEKWIITPGSYEAIIEHELFEKARDKILARRRQFSSEEIQRILKSVFDKYGLLSAPLIRVEETALTQHLIRNKFGSLPEAFQTFYPEVIETVKDSVFKEIAHEAKNVLTYGNFLVIDETFTVRVEPAMPMSYGYGYQWFFRQDMRVVVDITLGVPLSDEDQPEILGYFPLPRLMASDKMFQLTDQSLSKMEMHGYTGIDFILELIRSHNDM